MGLKTYKPTSPARRLMSVSDFAEITKAKPEKKLTRALRKSGGRNAHGHITTRHVGGGHKRRYRVIDWRRDKDGVPAKVASIEYDPNRTARIALLNYKDGEKRYMVAPQDLKVGDEIVSSKNQVEIKPGNRMPLSQIPVGILLVLVVTFAPEGIVGRLARASRDTTQTGASLADPRQPAVQRTTQDGVVTHGD